MSNHEPSAVNAAMNHKATVAALSERYGVVSYRCELGTNKRRYMAMCDGCKSYAESCTKSVALRTVAAECRCAPPQGT